MDDWKQELEYSNKVNQAYVLPIIKEWLEGKIEHVEEKRSEHKIIKLLDSFAGVDAIEVNPGKGLRGIALRCQWISNRRFDSFTIRFSRKSGFITEFDKRSFQLMSAEGWFYPALTVQAYFKKNGRKRTENLLSVGMANTRCIYEMIQTNKCNSYTAQDGNKYIAVGWDKMVEEGYDVRIFRT